ncbi:MAG: c-type cytochrome, partial [bacterium]|nr:c-type cytochrome [bacterium]
MANDVKPEPPEDSKRDPVADSTLSGPMLVFSALLFLSMVWAIYDELITERPWKHYQNAFTQLYSSYLNKLGPQQAAAEKQVRSSAEFQKIESDLKAAEDDVAQRVSEIDEELRSIRATLNVIKDPYQDARARIAALTYELDHTLDDGGKTSIREDIDEAKQGPFRVALNGADEQDVTFGDLDQRFGELKAREAQLNAERVEVTRRARQLRGARNQYLADNLVGLTQQQIDGLIAKMENFPIEIRQIHVEEAGLVDRCESCHLGIREPVTITAEDMRGVDMFVSHPNKPLLTLHDPERFGCSPCHNGNGLATSHPDKAHGQYKHWLWPLFAKQHSEAGCLKCHVGDRVLDHAEVLNAGRDLFHLKGCSGCHRHEQFDREADTLTAVQKQIESLRTRQKDARIEVDRFVVKGDTASTNEEAQGFYSMAEGLSVTASNIDAKIEELDRKAGHLMRDIKRLAPNLKDAKVKLRKEWIPVWLKDTQGFRPGTKMPQFRLTDEEIRGLSAFIWQSALEGPAPPSQPPGNAEAGQELFETRGCLACHSIGEGDNRAGGTFAANLSRLGEKINYDFVVGWVYNPRHRTQPYCPLEERDMGPEDYANQGLPFEFDLENATCPNDGQALQIQNMTVMPNLRLSMAEARDIATYLMSQQHDDASYSTDVSFMDDPQIAERGRELTSRYGCGSCHEVKGLELAPRIGTELTKESSKPMEQLDFGLLEHQAKNEGWYSHRGSVDREMAAPALLDQGREKAREELLRMRKMHLTE